MPINQFNFSEQMLELISTDNATAGTFSTAAGDFIRLTVFDTTNNVIIDGNNEPAIYIGPSDFEIFFFSPTLAMLLAKSSPTILGFSINPVVPRMSLTLSFQ